MRTQRTSIFLIGIVILAGCSSFKNHPSSYIKQPTVCIDKKWYGYHQDNGCPSIAKVAASDPTADRLSALERDREIAALSSQLAGARSVLSQSQDEKDRLAAELATAKQRITDLEGALGQSKGNLAQAERSLIKALQPEISKGTVSVSQTGDALTINLASSLLFDSGQDELKAGGADALQRIGVVLNDFPEKEVHVAGYADNVPIRGALKNKYPSNQELSDARAENAARALREGGVSSLTAAGHGESNPVASNNTAQGRAKNRRVEVIVK